MAILFRCRCDKKLEAREAFAGRRLRCPGCDRILRIPRPAGDEFVYFSCSCGKKMKAYKTDTGASVDCPACGSELQIPKRGAVKLPPPRPPAVPMSRRPPTAVAWEPVMPLPDAEPALTEQPPLTPMPVPAMAPILSAAHVPSMEGPRQPRNVPAAAGLPGDTWFTQHCTPWQSDDARKGNDPPPPERRVKELPWFRMLAVLLLGLLVGEWFLVRGGSHAAKAGAGDMDELTLLPPNAAKIVTIRFANLWHQEPELRQDSAAIRHAKELLGDLKNWKGDDIERVTAIWMPGYRDGQPAAKAGSAPVPPNDSCLIVHTHQNAIRSDIQEKLRKGKKTQFVQKTFYRRTYYESAELDKALYFADEKVFVVSNIKVMQDFLRSRPNPQEDHRLAQALEAAPKHDVVVALNMPYRVAVPILGDKKKKGKETTLLTSPMSIMTVDEARDDPAERQVKARLQMEFNKSYEAKRTQEVMKAAANHSTVSGNIAVFDYEGKGASASKAVDERWIKLATMADTSFQ